MAPAFIIAEVSEQLAWLVASIRLPFEGHAIYTMPKITVRVLGKYEPSVLWPSQIGEKSWNGGTMLFEVGTVESEVQTESPNTPFWLCMVRQGVVPVIVRGFPTGRLLNTRIGVDIPFDILLRSCKPADLMLAGGYIQLRGSENSLVMAHESNGAYYWHCSVSHGDEPPRGRHNLKPLSHSESLKLQSARHILCNCELEPYYIWREGKDSALFKSSITVFLASNADDLHNGAARFHCSVPS